MASQIPPPFPVPDDAEDQDRIDPDAPPPEEDPSLEQEDYKLPPMEPPAPVSEPRLPGA